MSSSRAFWSRAQSAAAIAPRAKMPRSSALWVSSMRSTGPGEDDRVLADHVAAAQARKVRCRRRWRAPVWPSRERTACSSARCPACGGRLAQQQRGAGRRVDLHPVMHLEDLDVEIVIKRLRRPCGRARQAGSRRGSCCRT